MLLLAARRAPPQEVATAFRRVEALQYDVRQRRGWTPDLYPEMTRYRDEPGVEPFFTPPALTR